MEIGTYCNRRCAWCPNGWSTRGQQHLHMRAEVWRALLDDLQRGGYQGWFAFHNHNEPLADPHLLERVADARRALPAARLAIYTNGRRLDRTLLQRLAAAGVDAVRVTLYPTRRRQHAAPEPAILLRFAGRLGVEPGARLGDRPRRLVCHARLGALRVLIGAPRPSTCTAGSSCCCHIYDTEDPATRPYVIGQVDAQPFSTLWRGPRLAELRARLARADFAGLKLCQHWTHRSTARDQHRLRRRRDELEDGS